MICGYTFCHFQPRSPALSVKMKKTIQWPPFFAGLGIAAVVVGMLHFLTGIGFWPLFAISTVAILVNLAISTTDEVSPDR
jgi:hypothetical protein